MVHDKAFVTRAAGTPAGVPDPTGNVVFHRYTTADCTGSPTDQTVALAADGTAESSTFTVAGAMSYKAHYNGDANYPAGDGDCEPLAVKVLLPCPAGLFLAGKTTGGSTAGDIAVAYDQFPAPNDNSYGVNAVGWPSGHTFSNLTGSDKAGFQIIKPDGTVAVSFNVDYISSKTGTPSGYASYGPFGGDGSILTNSTPALTSDGSTIQWDTSESRNLNGLQSPFGTYSTVFGPNQLTYFKNGTQQVGTSGTNSAILTTNSPPVDCTLVTDVDCVNPATSQYPLKTPNPWNASYDNPEYNSIPVGSSSFESALARHVNGWNFHDTFFVTYKQSYLTALGFNFANWETAQFNAATNTATCSPRGANAPWCVSPNTTTLHNSPAKPCPIQPIINVTDKTLSSKSVKVTFDNNTGVAQTLTGLAITWPQATNGNLLSVKLGNTTIYSTSTGGGSLTTSSLLGTAAQRTIAADKSGTLTYTFANNVSTNAANYTASATFNPFGPVTLLP